MFGSQLKLYISNRQSFNHSLLKHLSATAKNMYVLSFCALWSSMMVFNIIKLFIADLSFLPAYCISVILLLLFHSVLFQLIHLPLICFSYYFILLFTSSSITLSLSLSGSLVFSSILYSEYYSGISDLFSNLVPLVFVTFFQYLYSLKYL